MDEKAEIDRKHFNCELLANHKKIEEKMYSIVCVRVQRRLSAKAM